MRLLEQWFMDKKHMALPTGMCSVHQRWRRSSTEAVQLEFRAEISLAHTHVTVFVFACLTLVYVKEAARDDKFMSYERHINESQRNV
jgi:hypothetical protein